MIGFYEVKNIKSQSLFHSIKATLGWMDIPLTKCKVQCYDGASNMAVAKTGVATRINEIEFVPLWHITTVTLFS